MFPDTQMYAFSNVHIKVRNTKNHRVIQEVHKKNTITKYALNGIASMFKGEFNDTNYNRINNYVPKYLALGSNNPAEREYNITVGTNVTVFDDSLCSEIQKDDRLIRVKLEEARRIDNSSTNEYVKIRFKAMVLSGLVGYSTIIQELGLFVNGTELKGGLWARISTDPITIPENSVLDVIWDVVLASSVGIYPSKLQLTDANGYSISKPETPIDIEYTMVYPIAVNMSSAIIDGTTLVNAKFDVLKENIDNDTALKVKYISTNNFSLMVRGVEIYINYVLTSDTVVDESKTYYEYDSTFDTYTEVSEPSGNPHNNGYYEFDCYRIRTRWDDNDVWEVYSNEGTPIDFGTLLEAETRANILAKMGKDINGNEITEGATNVEAYTYKDVTYKNCDWILAYKNGSAETEVTSYKTDNNYVVGDFVIYNSQVYRCIEATTGDFDSDKWLLIMTFLNYMTNCIIINEYDSNDSNADAELEFKLTAIAASGISDYTLLNIKKNS